MDQSRPVAVPISPALDHVLVTHAAIEDWRREARYPTGRIGVIFGAKTAIHFCDPLNPLDFDFYPLPTFPDGVLLFERGASAYWAVRELHPNWEIIF